MNKFVKVSKSRFDRYIAWMAGGVIAVDAFTALLVLAGGCGALLGVLLWTVAAAFFVAGVLLPAVVRRFVARVSTRTVRLVILAAVVTAIPACLASLHRETNLGHCIA